MLVGLEHPGFAEVGLARHATGGVANDIALLVQPQHVTALAVDEGFIEKQALAYRAGDFRQFLAANRPDQALQGLVVEFDVAQNVAFDQLHDVVRRAHRRLLDTIALAGKQIADDGHDGEHGKATAQVEDQLGVRPVDCETRGLGGHARYCVGRAIRGGDILGKRALSDKICPTEARCTVLSICRGPL